MTGDIFDDRGNAIDIFNDRGSAIDIFNDRGSAIDIFNDRGNAIDIFNDRGNAIVMQWVGHFECTRKLQLAHVNAPTLLRIVCYSAL